MRFALLNWPKTTHDQRTLRISSRSQHFQNKMSLHHFKYSIRDFLRRTSFWNCFFCSQIGAHLTNLSIPHFFETSQWTKKSDPTKLIRPLLKIRVIAWISRNSTLRCPFFPRQTDGQIVSSGLVDAETDDNAILHAHPGHERMCVCDHLTRKWMFQPFVPSVCLYFACQITFSWLPEPTCDPAL